MQQIEGLASFKNLSDADGSVENIEIPESPENRRRTNEKWLIILGVVLLLWLPFASYTLYYSDISRSSGYDKCGNVCGKKNYKWEGISCSGQDFTDLPYLEIERNYTYFIRVEEIRCVQSCKEGFTETSGKCLKSQKDDENDYVFYSSVIWQTAIYCLPSILVTIGMLFLFRYKTAFVVWAILIGTFLLSLLIATLYWLKYMDEDDENAVVSLVLAIFFTIIGIIFGILFISFRKKIHLVILILKETTQALFDMPQLIVIPVLTGFAILILTLILFITTGYMASSGTLQKTGNESYTYVRNPTMTFTLIYNVFVFFVLWEFFMGIDYMIIAGAFAKWYFARNKSVLGSPMVTSMSIAFKFHLGTVAMGALIITIIRLIKWFIGRLIKKMNFEDNNCCSVFEYLTRNAYIVTALHGQPFLKSGKRAVKLFVQNFGDMLALNIVTWFVLRVVMFLIVIVSLYLSIFIFTAAVTVGVAGPLATSFWVFVCVLVVDWLFASIIFEIYQIGIDTIFICYCEDKLLNDGIAKPYFMSRNLAEFVQKSKEVYRVQ